MKTTKIRGHYKKRGQTPLMCHSPASCHSRAGGNPATGESVGRHRFWRSESDGKIPNGFTLIETLFAAMLIGLVIAAICVSSSAATMVNGAGIDISTAEFLTEEIRERTTGFDFDTLLTYSGITYSIPIDISGAAMPEFMRLFTEDYNSICQPGQPAATFRFRHGFCPGHSNDCKKWKPYQLDKLDSGKTELKKRQKPEGSRQ